MKDRGFRGLYGVSWELCDHIFIIFCSSFIVKFSYSEICVIVVSAIFFFLFCLYTNSKSRDFAQ